MKKSIQNAFLVLVLIQCMHSIEEYLGQLWEVFPPATFLCGLVSKNLETGFFIINIGLFVVGLLCWQFPVRNNYPIAKAIVWFWIILELSNSIIHTLWTLSEGSYTPGIITAPFLFVAASYLAVQMKRPNA